MHTPQQQSRFCDISNNMENLKDCLQWATTLAEMAWRISLEPLCHALAKAEALVQEQPLPRQEAQALVGHMRQLQKLLQRAGPIIDTWDESQVCIEAQTSGVHLKNRLNH